MKSRLYIAAGALFVAASFNVSAAIIDNGSYTSDTNSGLDWLDLTQTRGLSFSQVSAQLGSGGTFGGWQFATRGQVSGFWDAFGGSSAFYGGWSVENNGLFDLIAPLWGDTYCQAYSCAPGVGYSLTYTADYATPTSIYTTWAYDNYLATNSTTQDYFDNDYASMSIFLNEPTYASALVRVSTVPIPAAIWFFGFGLLGLVGMARRKKAA